VLEAGRLLLAHTGLLALSLSLSLAHYLYLSSSSSSSSSISLLLARRDHQHLLDLRQSLSHWRTKTQPPCCSPETPSSSSPKLPLLLPLALLAPEPPALGLEAPLSCTSQARIFKLPIGFLLRLCLIDLRAPSNLEGPSVEPRWLCSPARSLAVGEPAWPPNRSPADSSPRFLPSCRLALSRSSNLFICCHIALQSSSSCLTFKTPPKCRQTSPATLSLSLPLCSPLEAHAR